MNSNVTASSKFTARFDTLVELVREAPLHTLRKLPTDSKNVNEVFLGVDQVRIQTEKNCTIELIKISGCRYWGDTYDTKVLDDRRPTLRLNTGKCFSDDLRMVRNFSSSEAELLWKMIRIRISELQEEKQKQLVSLMADISVAPLAAVTWEDVSTDDKNLVVRAEKEGFLFSMEQIVLSRLGQREASVFHGGFSNEFFQVSHQEEGHRVKQMISAIRKNLKGRARPST